MNGFGEMLIKDLDTIFFNLEELADEHEINGKKATCILDVVEAAGSQASFSMHSRNAQYHSEMLEVGDRMLYIRDGFFKLTPKKDQRMDIDGTPYIVLDTRVNRGLLECHLKDVTT